ncbi:MAG: hypothetical protein MUE60_07175 [Candidatus Eisenbacteria bacterium]|nr:hypothetical protein [Candidatus Eisenbacteria bacterium]
MTGVFFAVVALMAAADLELPHLVVAGSAHVDLPRRDFWPEPAIPPGMRPRAVPAPRLAQILGDAPAGLIRRPPPAGFGAMGGVGPYGCGRVLAGIGETAGGLAAEAWWFDAGDLDRRGVRALAVASGRWGSAAIRVKHWADRLNGVGVAPGWVHGGITVAAPLSAAAAIRARLTGSGPDGEGIHGDVCVQGIAPRVELPFQVCAGDRVLGASIAWWYAPARMGVRAGPAMVDDGNETRWALEGSASGGPWELGRAAIGVVAERRLRLITAALLREQFPAAGEASARAEFVPWRAAATAQIRVTPRLSIGGSVEVREVGSAPAWRDDDSTWVVESLSGEGPRAHLSVVWRDGLLRAEAGLGMDGLKVARSSVSPAPNSSRWPLAPEATWWVRAAGGERPRIRLALEGDSGMRGWNDAIPASSGLSIEATLPLRAGWEAWLQAGQSWGWRLWSRPGPVLSVGIGWSLRRPNSQEGFV